MEAMADKTTADWESQAAGEKVWVATEDGGDLVLIQSESGNVAWLNDGPSTPCREQPENGVYARRMAAAWNACLGIPTAALEAARTGSVAAVLAPLMGKNTRNTVTALQTILDLVGQAATPGGIGEHEFTRPGGWRVRARGALDTLKEACAEGQSEVSAVLADASRVLPCHVFNIEAESTQGTMRYVVSKRATNSAKAQQAAMAHVLAELDEAEGSEADVIGSVEYLGTAAREFSTSAGPYKG